MKAIGFLIVIGSIVYLFSGEVDPNNFATLAPVFIGVAVGFFISGLDAFRS